MTVRNLMNTLSTTYEVDLVIGEDRVQCHSGTAAFVYCKEQHLMDHLVDFIVVINYHGPCTVIHIKEE